jgi:hypothetical protein
LLGWTTDLQAADMLHMAIAAGRGATVCSLEGPYVMAARPLGSRPS